jgi:hypothetical protein
MAGLKSLRRTYLTIFKLADHALFKIVWLLQFTYCTNVHMIRPYMACFLSVGVSSSYTMTSSNRLWFLLTVFTACSTTYV